MKYLILILCPLLTLIFLLNHKYLSKKFHLYDKSNKRKVHKGNISNIGGISIFFSLVVALVANQIFYETRPLTYFGVMIGLLTLIIILGYVDDKINLNPTSKTIFLAIVFISLAPLYQGFIIHNLEFLTLPNKIINLSKSSIFITFLCFYIFFNTVNFMDGLNGLLSSVSIFWTIIVILNKPFDLVEISFLTSLIIFMIFNLNKKIFLGNSGSNLIAIFLTLITVKNYNEFKFLKSDEIFFLFLFPGLDTVRVVVQRIMNGNNPFHPDKEHLHHLLMKYINKDFIWIVYLLLTMITYFIFKINFNIFTSFIISTFIYSYLLILLKNKK